ncbi:CPBP family intramembrane glutamic endopeptidase [Corynebacterium choanae]|uniref:CAAX amino terminal protease self-immunity n=1 Tax=Corynebacterium choanae TaxID=1862358 RepID=A0A3G6J3Q1_9CORY|nr:type II CAAX endopeptidase family protein [Corynebacterium choanae]AZA12695.1 CAAX amino terminal protease self- immunity [Corynebacterium choanae]
MKRSLSLLEPTPQPFARQVARVTGMSVAAQVIIPFFLGIAVLLLLPAVGTVVVALLTGESLEQTLSWASTAGMWVAVLGGAWLITRVSRISWRALGFDVHRWWQQLTLGFVAGSGLIGLVTAVLVVTGAVSLRWVWSADAATALAVAVLYFLAQGMLEELVYRGYWMPHFAKYFGQTAALAATAFFFAIMHGANPGLGVIPLLNLVLFGLVFGLLYWRTGSLWITGAAHSAWNLTQGVVVGAQVSGNSTGVRLWEATATGAPWLSGATFGFEGSVVVTALGLVLVVLLLRVGRPAGN